MALVLAACSNKEANSKEGKDANNDQNLNESGLPIVKEKIPLTFFVGVSSSHADDWNDILIWNEYKKMTNIDVTWDMVPREGLEEKRNLALASETLPDVFYASSIPNLDLIKYGEQGVFLRLNDLIDKYMPNLSEILEEYPEIKSGITFPEGDIYSLPSVIDPEFTSKQIGSKLWIREDWLDALDMNMPETTEEFYTYLKAVKETDLNDNGKDDEIPFGSNSIEGLVQWLSGSFGVATRGAANKYVDVDPKTNEMRFYPITEEYKEMLEYLNKLYSEGLIMESIYTIETNQSYANGSEDLYGSSVEFSTETAYGEESGQKFIGMPALEGPHGDRKLAKINSPLSSTGDFVVTSENDYPEATLKWIDYLYSEEGAKLFYMGVEGETYEETESGDLEFVEEIAKNPEGLTFSEAMSKYLVWGGVKNPGILKQDYFEGAENKKLSLDATELNKPYLLDEVWPKFTYTVDESKALAGSLADIKKYVTEMRDKFIIGMIPFSQWDKYVKTITDLGLEKYLQIEEAAYERYVSNQ